MHITSRDNSLLRQVRAVRDGKIEELIFIEGLRLCEEAHRSNLEIEAVIVSEELLRKERAAGAIDELSRVSKRVASVSEKLLESVSYTKTPQGIIVLAQQPGVVRRAAGGESRRKSAAGRAASDQQSCERWRDSAHGGSCGRNRSDHHGKHERSVFAEVFAWRDGIGVQTSDLEWSFVRRND